jgi:hypothetical protein
MVVHKILGRWKQIDNPIDYKNGNGIALRVFYNGTGNARVFWVVTERSNEQEFVEYDKAVECWNMLDQPERGDSEKG